MVVYLVQGHAMPFKYLHNQNKVSHSTSMDGGHLRAFDKVKNYSRNNVETNSEFNKYRKGRKPDKSSLPSISEFRNGYKELVKHGFRTFSKLQILSADLYVEYVN